MYTHIIVAADGSDPSYRAVAQAADLAGSSPDCRVTILFAVGAGRRDSLQDERLAAAQGERQNRLGRHEALLKQKQVPYTVLMKEGEPGPALVAAANEAEADMMIVGSRGLNPLQEFALGSISHKVMKRVQCPVMIVK